jgi:hypothetical protein
MYGHSRLDYKLLESTNFFGKLESDFEMYQTMIERFQFANQVHSFQNANNFSQYTVIGFHLRAGNGEGGDFASKNREIPSQDEWIKNLAHLLVNFTNTDPRFIKKRPLIFLATDTPTIIPHMQAAFGNYSIPVVTVPQARIPDGEGISALYRHSTAQACVETWKGQFSDMVLLGQSDVLVTGAYSSFSQTLPMALQFHKTAKRSMTDTPPQVGVFCEVGFDGLMMECFHDFQSWKTRRSTLPIWGNPKTRKQRNRHQVLLPNGFSQTKLEKLLEGSTVAVEYADYSAM